MANAAQDPHAGGRWFNPTCAQSQESLHTRKYPLATLAGCCTRYGVRGACEHAERDSHGQIAGVLTYRTQSWSYMMPEPLGLYW